MELDNETLWVTRTANLSYEFSVASRALCIENPSNRANPLEFIMNTLMTELWDRSFSQTEIRQAFLSAVEDLPRYAAGEETRT